jgi:hypothetical protein
MSKHRVKAEFTIEIHDQNEAEQVALVPMREIADQSIAEGVDVVTQRDPLRWPATSCPRSRA